MQNRAHDWPLWCSRFPAELQFLRWQCDHCPTTHICMKNTILDINPAPDNFTGFTLAFDCSAALRKVHGRLAFTHRSCITTYQGGWRYSARNLEYPDEIINIITFIITTPAYIM